MTDTTPDDRIRELDGLRATALLLVVTWHYLGTPDGPNHWLWKFTHVGRFGVDLFFVLSGYLITNILLKHREADNYFSSFYGRRALRIWPIYYLMCGLNFIGWRFNISPTMFNANGVPGWTYVLGLQNFGMAFAQNDGAYWLSGTWSLAIEEQFYLLFPLLVRRVSPERLIGILLVPIILCPIGRLIDAPLADPYGWYVLPQFRADSLAIGGAIAWWRIYNEPNETANLDAHRWFIRLFACLPLLWLFGWSRWSVAFSHTLVALFFGLMLFQVLQYRGSPSLAFLRTKIARFFAQTSYAAYMIHHIVAYAVFAIAKEPRTFTTPRGIELTSYAFVATFAICAVSYKYLEMPLIALGHQKFSYDERQLEI